uniref:Uncharacterized protein n=1 Tax=Ditylenchus dipsaci TaxID=166011 RepID=A0A915DFG4_9BILA
MDHKMMELSELEVQQIKDQNHRRIKRVVTAVAITLILISVILVALSLSLGPKIDQLVSESLDAKLSSKDLFLGLNAIIAARAITATSVEHTRSDANSHYTFYGVLVTVYRVLAE